MNNTAIRKNNLVILIALCIGWTLLYADRTALYPLLSIIGEDFNPEYLQIERLLKGT